MLFPGILQVFFLDFVDINQGLDQFDILLTPKLANFVSKTCEKPSIKTHLYTTLRKNRIS